MRTETEVAAEWRQVEQLERDAQRRAEAFRAEGDTVKAEVADITADYWRSRRIALAWVLEEA